MAQDDDMRMRDDNYSDFNDERQDMTNRSGSDRADEVLRNQDVDPDRVEPDSMDDLQDNLDSER